MNVLVILDCDQSNSSLAQQALSNLPFIRPGQVSDCFVYVTSSERRAMTTGALPECSAALTCCSQRHLQGLECLTLALSREGPKDCLLYITDRASETHSGVAQKIAKFPRAICVLLAATPTSWLLVYGTFQAIISECSDATLAGWTERGMTSPGFALCSGMLEFRDIIWMRSQLPFLIRRYPSARFRLLTFGMNGKLEVRADSTCFRHVLEALERQNPGINRGIRLC